MLGHSEQDGTGSGSHFGAISQPQGSGFSSQGQALPVTTGLSDGIHVEILSGLEEGSTYWYRIYDVVNY